MALVPMTQTDCTCGIPFSMPTRLFEKCRQNGATFYCPNGHSLTFNDTEIDKLRRERDRLKQQSSRKDDEIQTLERSVNAHKGTITKLKKRSAAGTCPCCNRTFKQLAAHMKSKHPIFMAESKAA